MEAVGSWCDWSLGSFSLDLRQLHASYNSFSEMITGWQHEVYVVRCEWPLTRPLKSFILELPTVSAVFSCLVWKPLCLLKPDYKRRTYFYLYPLCPSAPGISPLHQGLICIWMRHSDTEKLHPNSQFCIFNVADIVSSQPSPLAPAGDHGISFLFSFWSNELIVNQHEVCAIKKFWQTHSLSHAATTYLVI